jgi:hypothetical protein
MQILLILLSILPAAALAEGAVQRFSCSISTKCDVSGACEQADEAVEFVLTPVDVGLHGEGRYLLHYASVDVEMQWLTQYGPWVWSENGDDFQTIVISGPSTLVWIKDVHSQSGLYSETKFLNCEMF